MDASNRFVVSKNMGIGYPHSMITIKQLFHNFAEKFPRSEMGVAENRSNEDLGVKLMLPIDLSCQKTWV